MRRAILALLLLVPLAVYAGTGFSSGQGAGITGSSPSFAGATVDTLVLDRTNADVGIERGGASLLNVTDGTSGDGSLYVSAGSVSAPSVRLGDADTGIYLGTTDSVGVAVGGSLGLLVDSGGNVRNASSGFYFLGGTTGTRLYGGRVTGLTDSAANTVATITLGANGYAGGTLLFTLRVSDGTDHQILVQRVSWSGVDKAGTVTGDATVSSTESKTVTGGSTLTATWGVDTGTTNQIGIQVTPATSLTATTYEIRVAVLEGGDYTLTVP